MKYRLDALGYNLVTAKSVASAVSMITYRKPDLSLIDINLPDGTGFSVAKHIRNNPNILTIPVIFISASSSTEYKEKATLYSSTPLLEKPFDSSRLVEYMEFTQNTIPQ